MSRNAAQTEKEKAVFSAFLDSWPTLAREVQEWAPPDGEIPDIVSRYRDGSSEWSSPQGRFVSDFKDYPTIGKYLLSRSGMRTARRPGRGWIICSRRL